ncbi:MAG TPA: N-acetylmuramic acid 6-phosphate etherase [Bryobacteraceae bacterium]|nr:N-acetylmuramic acid 6-phosphate etherase [Bryobacteraceae bacterium]
MLHLGGLATEQRNPSTTHIDEVSTTELLALINKEDETVARRVGEAIGPLAAFLDRLTERVRAGGRLFYIGAGTSGRLGVLDASECPPTFGVGPEIVQGIIAGGEAALSRATEASEDDPESGARDLNAKGFQTSDTLVGIAASGRTPYVIGAIQAARNMGALTGAVVCVENSPMAEAAEFAIEVPVGPEVITGSTRMKAGTATKLVLNMMSTGLMIRLGCTYGNLMVNVQPKNEKLVDRALRIVSEAGSVPLEQAATLLAAAGNQVKPAIVMARLGISRAEAEERLARANGILAEVVRG